MKILLVAINAKYIHSNLAVHYLREYASDYKNQTEIAEYTINQHADDILQSIYKKKPDIIGFSCYIWNISLVEELCKEIRKILPYTKIWLGGPEVSYDGKECLSKNEAIDGVILGEGEEAWKELLEHYFFYKPGYKTSNSLSLDKTRSDTSDGLCKPFLSSINGIVYRENEEETKFETLCESPLCSIIQTSDRRQLDFTNVPFPYDDLEKFKNKIIYYETSRGCPFSCSYCLSSIDKGLRIKNIDIVKKELDFFLRNKVKQVKFVDRTFNCKKDHSLAIWNYIKEHDNGVTNFHFEIAADLLGEEEIKVISSMRKGLIQLEIGVQSTNPQTLDAIHRKTDFDQIKKVVKVIHKGRNVHQHLDLIAGLPYEDYTSFRKSFHDVYSLQPDQLQLGFLKVLKGSRMFSDSKEYGIVYKDISPYEVLYTNWLNYDEVLRLKEVEEMVEVYYNSGQFTYSIQYMEHFFDSPFDLYERLGAYYASNQLFDIKHSRIRRYEILIDFMKNKVNDRNTFEEILVYDLYLRENLKSRPFFANSLEQYKEFYHQFYRDKEILSKYIGEKSSNLRIGKAKQFFHIEHFNIDIVKTARTGKTHRSDQFILFDYMCRNPLNNEARTVDITEKLKHKNSR